MEKDKSSNDYQAKKLVQLFCSSFYVSSYSNEKLSVKELSTDVLKVLEKYDKIYEESIKEFDGYSFEKTTSDTFKQRRANIQNKLER